MAHWLLFLLVSLEYFTKYGILCYGPSSAFENRPNDTLVLRLVTFEHRPNDTLLRRLVTLGRFSAYIFKLLKLCKLIANFAGDRTDPVAASLASYAYI